MSWTNERLPDGRLIPWLRGTHVWPSLREGCMCLLCGGQFMLLSSRKRHAKTIKHQRNLAALEENQRILASYRRMRRKS